MRLYFLPQLTWYPKEKKRGDLNPICLTSNLELLYLTSWKFYVKIILNMAITDFAQQAVENVKSRNKRPDSSAYLADCSHSGSSFFPYLANNEPQLSTGRNEHSPSSQPSTTSSFTHVYLCPNLRFTTTVFATMTRASLLEQVRQIFGFKHILISSAYRIADAILVTLLHFIISEKRM